MWKASVVVGAFEVLTYALIAIVSMLRAGQGSGVWIPLLPLFWMIASFRLWVILRAADAARDIGSWQFVLIAAIFGFLLCMVFIVSAGNVEWSVYIWVILPVSAHIAAAVLASRGVN